MSYILAAFFVLALVCGGISGRMAEVSAAAMEGAGAAVELCLSMAGAICLWSGVMTLMERGGLSEKLARLLRPVVRVDYYREAFTFPVSHTRVTFDKRLSTGPFPAGLFDLSPGIMALDDEREILEVKYDQILPDVVRLLLAGVPAERSAISKYVLCRRFDLMK